MPQTLTPVPFGYIPGSAGVDVTPADLAAATSTSLTFAHSGNVILVVYNGSGSSITVTPTAIRGVQNVIPTIPPSSLPTLKSQAYGPFPVKDFGSPMTVVLSAITTVSVAAFEMTEA
jgi:hypothetical protein